MHDLGPIPKDRDEPGSSSEFSLRNRVGMNWSGLLKNLGSRLMPLTET